MNGWTTHTPFHVVKSQKRYYQLLAFLKHNGATHYKTRAGSGHYELFDKLGGKVIAKVWIERGKRYSQRLDMFDRAWRKLEEGS